MASTLDDQIVRRVLGCLVAPRTRYQSQSLEEVTDEYNQKYPPPLGLFPMRSDSIKCYIDHLVSMGYVRGEVFSIIYRMKLKRPTKFYVVTALGMQAYGRHR